jgi:hypothetical protein
MLAVNKQLIDAIHTLFYTFNPAYKVMATVTIIL